MANSSVPHYSYAMAAERLLNGGVGGGVLKQQTWGSDSMPIFPTSSTTITASSNPMVVAQATAAGHSFLSGMGLTPITFANTTISAAAVPGGRHQGVTMDPMLVFSTGGGVDATK